MITEKPMMNILSDQIVELERGFQSALAPHLKSGDEAMLFDELSRLRGSIPELALCSANGAAPEALPETWEKMQMRLHFALDDALKKAIGKLIETRTRDFAEQAQRDALTGIFNRGAFDRRLNDELERARRYRRTLSLILFDIDHFKSINDRFGHPAGDQALRLVAQILQSSLRRSDAAFRHGGDEFAAICPETSSDAALTLVSRIEISLKKFCHGTRTPGPFTISWGVASFPIHARQIDDLFLLADQRLYECKKSHHWTLAAAKKC